MVINKVTHPVLLRLQWLYKRKKGSLHLMANTKFNLKACTDDRLTVNVGNKPIESYAKRACLVYKAQLYVVKMNSGLRTIEFAALNKGILDEVAKMFN